MVKTSKGLLAFGSWGYMTKWFLKIMGYKLKNARNEESNYVNTKIAKFEPPGIKD